MNLKIANLIISDLRILRLQGFKARNGVRRILTPAGGCCPRRAGGQGGGTSGHQVAINEKTPLQGLYCVDPPTARMRTP